MHTCDVEEPKEIWKSPPSLNRLWVEVSNLGRVRTLDHKVKVTIKGVTFEREEKGTLRKYTLDSRGRKQIGISTKRRMSKLYLLHRLVAECFVKNPNPEAYDFVFFKNGDIKDCRASNLEWGNNQDKSFLSRGTKAKYSVDVYDNDVKVGTYQGCGETARVLDCTKQCVSSAIRDGRLCKGFKIVASKAQNRKGRRKNIDECRKKNRKSFDFIEMPDSIFL